MADDATEPMSPGERRITVPGRGSVRAEPDVASVRLGVLTVRPTASDARAAAATTMEAVLAAIRSLGVETRDLRTSLLGLDAVRDYSTGDGSRITGYQLTNAVEVTIRRVDATGAVIDAALAAGATSLDGLAFRVDDPADAMAEARRLAVADARARAETLATEAGVALGAIIGIVEGGELAPGPPRPAKMLRLAAASDAATPVEAGASELAVDLVVAFAIR